jgi:hypothetical protein
MHSAASADWSRPITTPLKNKITSKSQRVGSLTSAWPFCLRVSRLPADNVELGERSMISKRNFRRVRKGRLELKS